MLRLDMGHDRLISFRPEIQDFGPGKVLVSVMHLDRLDDNAEARLLRRHNEFRARGGLLPVSSLEDILVLDEDEFQPIKSSLWSRLKAWFKRWCEVPR